MLLVLCWEITLAISRNLPTVSYSSSTIWKNFVGVQRFISKLLGLFLPLTLLITSFVIVEPPLSKTQEKVYSGGFVRAQVLICLNSAFLFLQEGEWGGKLSSIQRQLGQDWNLCLLDCIFCPIWKVWLLPLVSRSHCVQGLNLTFSLL